MADFREVFEDFQADFTAFFGVKLGAVNIALLDRGGHRETIVGIGDFGLGVSNISVERVCEIEMFFSRQSSEQIHIFGEFYEVPAHMRDSLRRGDLDDIACDQAEAFVGAVFRALVEKHLVADADTEQRFAGQNELFYQLRQRA